MRQGVIFFVRRVDNLCYDIARAIEETIPQNQ